MSTYKPFSQSSPNLHGMVQHPEFEFFRNALKGASQHDRETIARLWLSEGIPYAFRGKPSAYDELRYWLAEKLNVNGKDITIVGSGRIGFSMSPSKYGRGFGSGSDLDISIVSLDLFKRCSIDALEFKENFLGGKLNPNAAQKKFWPDTVKRLPSNLSKGFINTFQIPGTVDQAPNILLVNNSMWHAGERLKVTEGVPAFTKISARIYRDWNSLVDRIAFNLESIINK